MKLGRYNSLEEKNPLFIDNKKIDSLDELKSFIDTLKVDDFVFRGLKDARFKLYTSLQRDWIETNYFKNKLTNKGRSFISPDELEIKLIDIVKSESELCAYLTGDGIDVNIMALLQHFGKPTPLLDFTEDLNSALFFLCDGLDFNNTSENIDGYCSLYYIEKSSEKIGISLENIVSNGLKGYEDMIINNQDKLGNCDYYSSFIRLRDLSYKWLTSVNGISHPITIKGGVGSATSYEATQLGFKMYFEIKNPRMYQQKGLFIMNNSETEPLENVLNYSSMECEWDSKFENLIGFKENSSPAIHCINIKKSILKNYPLKYTKEDIYSSSLGSKLIGKKFDSMDILN